MPVEEAQLNRVWASLRRRNERLPKARIVVIPGKRGSGCGEVEWWESESPVLLVPAELLTDPQRTLEFLLHNAGHALTPGGGLGTASQGRWHNRQYRVLAEVLGLEVSGSAGTITTLTDESVERYTTELKLLKDAL